MLKIVSEETDGLTGFVVRAGVRRARATEARAGPRHCGESQGSGQASRGRADILGSREWPGSGAGGSGHQVSLVSGITG